MTQASSSPRDQYGTLGDVNARLRMLGFAQIGSEQAQNILGQVPRHRLIKALQKAHVDQGARRFLETLIPVAQDEPQKARAGAQRQTASNNAPAQPRPQQAREPRPHQSFAGNREQRSQSPQHERGGHPPQGNEGRPTNRQPSRPAQNREREFMSHHVYGGKAALCWDVDQTKNGDATIRLEAAKSVGERKYDWGNKISIQLTRDELPCVAAVFLGILQRTEGRNHGYGDQQGKGFEIEHQGSNLFVKVFAPQRPPCAVPVSPEDAFTVAGLLVRQIRKGKPWLSGNDIMTMLRAIIGRMKTQPSRH